MLLASLSDREAFNEYTRCRSLSPRLSTHSDSSLLSRFSIYSPTNFNIRRRLHSLTGTNNIRTKPPSILIYTGDKKGVFERIKSTLSHMISPEVYTLFHLSTEALKLHPWIGAEAACLLVADTESLDDECWAKLHEYFNSAGKLLFVCHNNLLSSITSCENLKKTSKLLNIAFLGHRWTTLGKDFENFLKRCVKLIAKNKNVNETYHAKDLSGGYKYSIVINKTNDAPLLLYMENRAQCASALFSDATSEQLLVGQSPLLADAFRRLGIGIVEHVDIPPLSRGYFICETDRLPWNMTGMKFNENFGDVPKILIRQVHKHGDFHDEPTGKFLPIEVRTRNEGIPDFNSDAYFEELKSKRLGKALIHIPVVESTQTVAQSFARSMPEEPILVVARIQTQGKGRSGNQWLSPVGSALFSFNFLIPESTELAANIGFIQHVFCVAIVDGICSLVSSKDPEFPLKIKWPNDIYYGRVYKMGGLIVNAQTVGNRIVCTLGAGINVANSHPTVCLNDMLCNDRSFRLSVEKVIANVMNKFEYYIEVFQSGGREAFLPHYYNYWLHSREEVKLAKTNEKLIIRGLDKHGFLEVRSRHTGKVMVVHPDGNSFDMMRGLITVKY
ncbi:hypothetical protein AB6A40_005419 [Gnathostoma spinigerum]|uniref:BPL/LPL catalytic domain-containing protein n=1 Tax=Gnathostoma spinigerum TaxID=75299 RepID=A0ABD6EFD4_9BILA